MRGAIGCDNTCEWNKCRYCNFYCSCNPVYAWRLLRKQCGESCAFALNSNFCSNSASPSTTLRMPRVLVLSAFTTFIISFTSLLTTRRSFATCICKQMRFLELWKRCLLCQTRCCFRGCAEKPDLMQCVHHIRMLLCGPCTHPEFS